MGYTIDHTLSADRYLPCLYEIKSDEKNKYPFNRGKAMEGGLFNYRRMYDIIYRYYTIGRWRKNFFPELPLAGIIFWHVFIGNSKHN